MIYVELLVTHPDYQGRGYASALLETILFIVSPGISPLFHFKLKVPVTGRYSWPYGVSAHGKSCKYRIL